MSGLLSVRSSVWSENNALCGLSLGEALRNVPSCNSGLAAPSSYWLLLAEVKSSILQRVSLALRSRRKM